jgi:hypothetical protein
VEAYDQSYSSPSYGYGYGNGYGYGSGNSSGYYSSGYYAQPTYSRPVVNNYYTTYTPPPQVVTQTRYVPVPTPPQRQVDRSTDHRWDGHHDQPRHVDRQPQPSPPPAAHNPPSHANNQPSNGNHRDANRRDGNRDRDGDGRPDRRS